MMNNTPAIIPQITTASTGAAAALSAPVMLSSVRTPLIAAATALGFTPLSTGAALPAGGTAPPAPAGGAAFW